jgi:hypothetical protein
VKVRAWWGDMLTLIGKLAINGCTASPTKPKWLPQGRTYDPDDRRIELCDITTKRMK